MKGLIEKKTETKNKFINTNNSVRITRGKGIGGGRRGQRKDKW